MTPQANSDATSVGDDREPVVIEGITPDEHITLRREMMRQQVESD